MTKPKVQKPIEKEQDEKIQLNLDAIPNAVKIIDIACARGAIKGEEMAQVGMIREGLNQILRDVQLIITNQEEQTDNG